MKPRLTGLWCDTDFLYLWSSQAVSTAGSAVTGIALPLTAVLFLHASAAQMGYLGVAMGLPALFFSLSIGVWVDRWHRRKILIWADLGRAVLMGLIPLTALAGVLRMEFLYVIAFAIGTLSLFFDIAITSFLPAVVERESLLEGNQKLQMSSSTISVVGKGVGGILVQVLTAPGAIVLDSLSFLFSALMITRIRIPEPKHNACHLQKDMRREVLEGLRFLLGERNLRLMTLSSALGSLGGSIQGTVLVLYATRSLDIAPALLGVILASRGVAAVLGSAIAGAVGNRFGAGHGVIWGTFIGCLGALVLAVASRPPVFAATVLIAGQVLSGIGQPVYSVNQITLRQEITPDRLLGRVNAGRRFLVFGVAPVGAFIGGLMGTQIGLRPTLFVGGLVTVLAFFVVLFSPLRTLKLQSTGIS